MRPQEIIYHKNELQGSVSMCKSWIWDARMMNVIHNYFKDTFRSVFIPRLLPNIPLLTFFIKITNLLLFPSLNNLILLCFSTINDGFELCFHISTHLCPFNWLKLICILKPWWCLKYNIRNNIGRKFSWTKSVAKQNFFCSSLGIILISKYILDSTFKTLNFSRRSQNLTDASQPTS